MGLSCCGISCGKKKQLEKEEPVQKGVGWGNAESTSIKPVAPGMMVTRPTKFDGKGMAKNKIKILKYVKKPKKYFFLHFDFL